MRDDLRIDTSKTVEKLIEETVRKSGIKESEIRRIFFEWARISETQKADTKVFIAFQNHIKSFYKKIKE